VTNKEPEQSNLSLWSCADKTYTHRHDHHTDSWQKWSKALPKCEWLRVPAWALFKLQVL